MRLILHAPGFCLDDRGLFDYRYSMMSELTDRLKTVFLPVAEIRSDSDMNDVRKKGLGISYWWLAKNAEQHLVSQDFP
jgi:hypothetical protein